MNALYFLSCLLASLMIAPSAMAIKMKGRGERSNSYSSARSSSLSYSSSSKGKDCSLQLQGIIHKPDSCGMSYLQRIAKTLPHLDVAFFQNTYPNVTINVTGQTGIQYFFLDGIAYVSGTQSYPHSFSQANLNLGGFSISPAANYAYYTYTAQDRAGIFYYVTLSIPINNIPVACAGGCQF